MIRPNFLHSTTARNGSPREMDDLLFTSVGYNDDAYMQCVCLPTGVRPANIWSTTARHGWNDTIVVAQIPTTHISDIWYDDRRMDGRTVAHAIVRTSSSRTALESEEANQRMHYWRLESDLSAVYCFMLVNCTNCISSGFLFARAYTHPHVHTYVFALFDLRRWGSLHSRGLFVHRAASTFRDVDGEGRSKTWAICTHYTLARNLFLGDCWRLELLNEIPISKSHSNIEWTQTRCIFFHYDGGDAWFMVMFHSVYCDGRVVLSKW